MGIYIKGMKMPKDDEVIRFIKLLNGKTIAVKEKVRKISDIYDIVEVTEPHGPLIDAEYLAEHLYQCQVNDRLYHGMEVKEMIDCAMDTPTVIEAEGE